MPNKNLTNTLRLVLISTLVSLNVAVWYGVLGLGLVIPVVVIVLLLLLIDSKRK